MAGKVAAHAERRGPLRKESQMHRCRITVLETQFNEGLARIYGVNQFGPCPYHKVGQVFEGDYKRPEGFCEEAWKAIQHYVFALAHGVSEPFFCNRWMKEGGISINSCNDGLRPVIFKVERITP
jgi:uncharacterized repeat protein (TIGR04076 family)